MAAYWGIGTYWGKAQSNNKKGHLIGHIRDIGHDPKQATTRLYATHEAQPYHNDSSDQVGARHERPQSASTSLAVCVRMMMVCLHLWCLRAS
jgi:hypothetical protein